MDMIKIVCGAIMVLIIGGGICILAEQLKNKREWAVKTIIDIIRNNEDLQNAVEDCFQAYSYKSEGTGLSEASTEFFLSVQNSIANWLGKNIPEDSKTIKTLLSALFKNSTVDKIFDVLGYTEGYDMSRNEIVYFRKHEVEAAEQAYEDSIIEEVELGYDPEDLVDPDIDSDYVEDEEIEKVELGYDPEDGIEGE